ncbi:MAG: DUF1987 domain-containing protein [Flavobacteriales bacterium]|nr:DUF1987 domain-containing protein [Flavobacteriales bacterium]
MSSLILEEGKNTPEIVFNPSDNVFTIKGKSFPENAKKFYAEVLDWLDHYSPDNELTFEVVLYYISSSSIISILEIIRRLDKINANVKPVSINWYYEADDDDIKKIGEDYQRISSISINLIAN